MRPFDVGMDLHCDDCGCSASLPARGDARAVLRSVKEFLAAHAECPVRIGLRKQPVGTAPALSRLPAYGRVPLRGVVHRVADADAVRMECPRCGAHAPFDEYLPYVNQTASFATDHGCP